MNSTEAVLGMLLLAGVALAVRVVGYAAAACIPASGFWPRLVEAAPGNLFIAFATVGVLGGGVAAAAGVACSIGMALLYRHNELLPLLAGALGVALVHWLMPLLR
jgi:hypothetical protein